MTFLFSLILLSQALGFSSAGQSASAATLRPLREADLQKPWLDHSEPFTPQKLKILIDLATRTPRTAKLVQAAMERFGASDLDAFFPLFVAENLELDIVNNTFVRRGGETRYGELNSTTLEVSPQDRFSTADLATVAPYEARVADIAMRREAYAVWVENHSVTLEVCTLSHPLISLTRDETLEQTYENFIHELTHFTRFDLRTEPNPLDYADAASYEAAYLLSPGQEIEARVSGVQALIELLRAYPSKTSLPISPQNWFSPTGKLRATNERLLHLIRDEMGYGARATYRNRLSVLVAAAERELAELGRLRDAGDPDPRLKNRIDALAERLARAKARLDAKN